MNNYFIYKYEFEDGSVYIGQSSHKQNRYKQPSQYKNCKRLYNKFKKYNFQYNAIIVEDNISQEDIDLKEIFYIKEYNSHYKYNIKYGLNLTTGGQGIHDLPYECKQKISDGNKGKHHSPKTEFQKGMIPWNKGTHPNLDYTKQINMMQKAKTKEILCSNGKIYKGSYEASRDLGVDSSAVIKCCRGKLKQTHGFTFSYYQRG